MLEIWTELNGVVQVGDLERGGEKEITESLVESQ